MELKDNVLYQRTHALKLYGLLAHFEAIQDRDWLTQVLEWEETERAQRSLERRLQHARLGRFKLLSDFDWSWPTRCDRDRIEACLQLDFIPEVTNLILCGPNGVGKTTIACNIAHQAVLKGHTAYFTTASALLNDLILQESDRTLRKRVQKYIRPQLLVIDEIGYLSYSNRHADLLFEVISRRYEEKPTLITTNKPFAEWNDIFPNASCVVSLIDRLVHRSEIIAIEAASFRLKEAKEQAEQRKQRKQNTTEKQSNKKNKPHNHSDKGGASK